MHFFILYDKIRQNTRIFEGKMEFSNQIENILEIALKNVNREKLKKEAINLSKRYCEEERKNQSFISSKETALAYAIIRMPATYYAVKNVLKELKQRIEDDYYNIKTILDLGAGTGAATIALKNEFTEAKITCIEREKEMIRLGKEIISQMKMENIEWLQEDILQKGINQRADLIIESYLTNEWKRRGYRKNIFTNTR